MSNLKNLKSAFDLSDLAKILGFTPKGLTYVLYKIGAINKYHTFDIPKKSGGTRKIQAPTKQLSLLQKRLSELLYHCVSEIQKENPRFWAASHGFYKGRSIVSNAEIHRRRRFVFNVDIEDFFGTINFGRVRGFFIKDNSFKLAPSVATVIAQIACHENALPQGSPCSPVISNLIGNILDARLLALARDTRCTYTRYADDLTFSTNEKHFPTEIAANIADSTWTTGSRLESELKRAGFKLNHSKTRMSLRRSRQTVTGLVVNKKANINRDYYRMVRAICNSAFQTGSYYRPVIDENTGISLIENLSPVEGMLSHIYFVKARRDRSKEKNNLAIKAGEFLVPKAPKELYRKFLFFKHFVVPKSPLIVTEGISDITYLKCAIRSLAKSFPSLIMKEKGSLVISVNFLKPTGTTRDILNLGYGTAGQASLISQYAKYLKKYAHRPLDHPVIILCDNDGGPKTVFKVAKSKSRKDISIKTTKPFYYLGQNLYLVKVPEGTPAHNRDMEDLFPPKWLKKKLNGKPFDRKKDHGDTTAFGKVIFAEKIVRPNASKIDFSSFADLLSRIDACITHYKTVRAIHTATPVGTISTMSSP